jgi:phage regulator Rha-like protein
MSPTQAVHDLGRVILTVRETKVILDDDLAMLYGVATKTLNRAVKRNLERFPESFMFQLKRQEFTNLKSQIVTSNSHDIQQEDVTNMRYQIGTASRRRNVRFLPYAFTEHGALMAANVLKSPKAVKMSVALIEAFVRLRQEFASTQALSRRLAEIEKTVMTHDRALVKLFEVIKPLLAPPPAPPRKKIGFHP